jgi:hypothetical protein
MDEPSKIEISLSFSEKICANLQGKLVQTIKMGLEIFALD